jgi:hypothetical protein
MIHQFSLPALDQPCKHTVPFNAPGTARTALVHMDLVWTITQWFFSLLAQTGSAAVEARAEDVSKVEVYLR